MNGQQKSALISALRTVLAVVASFVFASFVSNGVFAAALDVVSVGVVAYWSFAEKSDTAQSAFSMVMGPLRNLLAAAVVYASTRGWLTADQAKTLEPSIIVIVVALWGVEQKVVAAKAAPALLLAMLFAPALVLYGCGTASFGSKDMLTLLNDGRSFYTGLCQNQPSSSYCTEDAKKKAADAYTVAKKAIASYKSGKLNYAAAEQALLAAWALYGDFSE